MWEISAALILVVLTLLWLLYRKRCRQLRVFRDMGIPGPTPHWLYGNYKDLQPGTKQAFELYQDWKKEYGTFYGYFEGPVPILVTSDLDFIQETLVKNFSKFNARKEFPIQPSPESPGAHMVLAHGQRWKRLRTIVNPTFSTSKLKQMYPLMVHKVDILMERFATAAQKNEKADVLQYYQALTLDVIGDVGFGMEVDSQKNPDDFLLRCAIKVFDMLNTDEKPFLILMAELFPEIRRAIFHLFMLILKVMKLPTIILISEMEKVIKRRKSDPESRRTDVLQLMLEAEADHMPDDQSELLTMSTEDDPDTVTGDKPKDVTSRTQHVPFEKKLSTEEIVVQSFLFLTAGYETTSAGLSFATFLLATNPEKQHKLTEEIDRISPAGEEVTYKNLQDMTYLHDVICETLRLYPVGYSVVNRLCLEPCTIKGMDIPKGLVIQPDVWGIHRDPDVWGANPEDFIPERFNKEEHASRHPMAWMPFGGGPRNCVGLRFALMEIKMSLARILQRFKFEECPETRENLVLEQKLIVGPKHGITVKIVARSDK